MEEKILGVIGGMGPEATKLFLEMVIRNTDASRDQDHLNMMILNHTSIPDRTNAILSGDTEPVKSKLVEDAVRLEKNGCSAVAVTCNTAHYFAEDIREAIRIPFVNMIEEAAKETKKAEPLKVGILATSGTIATNLYQKALEKEGVSWAVPDPEAQETVMSIIYDDIKGGKPLKLSRLTPVIENLQKQGCDLFLLGCTELSVLGVAFNLPAEMYINAMNVLARKCIELCGKPLKD